MKFPPARMKAEKASLVAFFFPSSSAKDGHEKHLLRARTRAGACVCVCERARERASNFHEPGVSHRSPRAKDNCYT